MKKVYKKAYAKINIFLEVLYKRDDGFHEIRTVMQAVSLYDELFVSLADKDSIEVIGAGEDVPLDENNIVIKALNIFREKTGFLTPVNIQLLKNIPSQAGLGGGSSDCASMLDALNNLFDNPLSRDELSEIGSELGSDVAFFLYLPCAVCTGRGEIVKPVEPLKCNKFLYLVRGNHFVSTKDAYANMKKVLTLEKKNSNFRYFHSCSNASKLDFLLFVHNDFERVVYDLYRDLREFRSRLDSCNVEKVWMTGSGSAHVVVAEVDIEKELKNIDKDIFVKRVTFVNS